MSQEQEYWLAWSQIKGIGPVSLKKIYQHFGSLEKAWNAPAIAFGELEGLNQKIINAVQSRREPQYPATLLAQHLVQNPQFWVPSASLYPKLLEEIPSPPPLLYYLGQVEPTENDGSKPMIGIVGTRNPTEYGKRWTRKITQTLVSQGFGIVSGMAAGIDTVAHQACLEAGGRTIAVLGTGVDVVYPYSNRQLYQKLQQQGLLVSEYPAQTQPDRNHFPARNRIIAGLCRAVLIMEAPQRSGALITARFANDFGRDVYVLPGSLDSQQSVGCLALLNSGAHVILGIEQLLEMLGTMPNLVGGNAPSNGACSTPSVAHPVVDLASESTPIPDLTPELASIYRLLNQESVSIEAIEAQTGLGTSEILAALSQLEIMDLVTQLPGMRYQLKN